MPGDGRAKRLPYDTSKLSIRYLTLEERDILVLLRHGEVARYVLCGGWCTKVRRKIAVIVPSSFVFLVGKVAMGT